MKFASQQDEKFVGWSLHAVGLLVGALVVTAFYQLSYAQLAEKSEAHSDRTEQLSKLLATSESVRENHKSLRQELDNLEKEAAKMRGRLPQNLQQDQFEASIRLAATSTKFQLEHAAWSTPKLTPTHSHTEVTVNGVGSFASICRFLDEVNQLARITKISKLKLATDPKSESYPLQVTFVLVYGVESNDTDNTRGVL